jgi:DAK2 domain fusion protein YloV
VTEPGELRELRRVARAAAAALEASRQRIDDLNVYPVPDGDTGTNMVLTVRAVLDALEALDTTEPSAIAHALTRAALMGARGNSGVILSQIVRGLAEVVGAADRVDAPTLARAFRSASDAAHRGVRRPVEGTMLTVIREVAEEAESRAAPALSVPELFRALLDRGEDALSRTPQLLDVLREAGVVDAGGAGLVELLRGAAAALVGEPLPEPLPRSELGSELGLEAIHREQSRYRYCTVFVVEGDRLQAERLEEELERLGDSLLVVGDGGALKVHVHTDDPGAALSLGTARGVLDGVEIADMRRQAAEREERLLRAVPAGPERRTGVVAVVAGAGNRALYESLGAAQVIDGGPSMNPSTAEIVAALAATAAPEAIVLPNDGNVIMSAEQAVRLAPRPARVVATRSIQAGLAAMVVYDAARSAAENAAVMEEAVSVVATGAVTTASREVELNGLEVRAGDFLGLLEGSPVAGGEGFDEVATAVVEQLLAEPREVLTLLVGQDGPGVDRLVAVVGERHPGLELDVQPGGQPVYHLLLSAE